MRFVPSSQEQQQEQEQEDWPVPGLPAVGKNQCIRVLVTIPLCMSLAMNLSGESSPLCLMSLWVVKEGEIAFVVSMPLCITGSGIFLKSILMHRTKNMPPCIKLKLQQKLPSTNPFGNKTWKCNMQLIFVRSVFATYVTNPGANSGYYSHSNQGMRR